MKILFNNQVFIMLILGLVVAGCTPTTQDTAETLVSITPAQLESEFQPYTARFVIVTKGTTRNFSDAMYLHQSTDAYIDSSDPQQIQIKTAGVTWNDFFATLPFSLDESCLVTGTGQQFCTGSGGQLIFRLNDQPVNQVLDQVIQPEDELLIEYR